VTLEVIKRNGRKAELDYSRIENAVLKAFQEFDHDTIPVVIKRRLKKLYEEIKESRKCFHVETIQDRVEKILMSTKFQNIAKSYIIYRHVRNERRHLYNHIIGTIDGYISKSNWRVKENSNMNYSLQGLNNHITGYYISEYWLNKIYNGRIRKAHQDGTIHIHDLSSLSCYCMGWNLQDLLLQGFGGVKEKIESNPPSHLDTALGQLINFFFTLQGEAAGAQAVSSFDTLLAPFIRYDNLSYDQVKKILKKFMFNMNVPTRVGFQAPFTNITMDLIPTGSLAEEYVIIGGEYKKEQYKDFQKEIDLLNKAFVEVMMDGDSKGRMFSFPIPTYNITKDFDWDSEVFDSVMDMTAKYGIPYFSNFVNSDMDVEDARSMCCRLRLDNRELRKRGGGLFGSNPLTGSIGVVTLNLPKLAHMANLKSKKRNQEEFLKYIEKYLDLAKESLEIKRDTIEQLASERNLYPYSRHYLKDIYERNQSYFLNHFSTIGVIGGHEACMNLLGVGIDSEEGKELIENVMNYIRMKLQEYQHETMNFYNLEAIPGEGTSHRLANKDYKKYGNKIYTQGENDKFYSNSTQLPVNYTEDLFEVLEHQDSLQTMYTGGTVIHLFNQEENIDGKIVKDILKKIMTTYSAPYFSWTPTFSVCQDCGRISGEHFKCPKCQKDCEVWSRVCGYYRPVQNFNNGKKEEYKTRITYRVDK
jgi:ribonucleoside-triphosphate reductase